MPAYYPYQAIAEALLLDVYNLKHKKPDLVIEVGASIGDFTLFAASNSSCKVIAYEALNCLSTTLQENVTRNGFSHVEVRGEATAQDLTFDISNTPVGHTIFMKLDCEGAEYQLLTGIDTSLLRRVKEIHMEIHPPPPPYTPLGLKRHLADAGFRIKSYNVGGCPYLSAVR